MRAIIQRVSSCRISAFINDSCEHEDAIKHGLLVYAGFSSADDAKDIQYIAKKICALRIFNDDQGKMNLSVKDVDGEIAVVSQFTLYGDARKGNRPSYNNAASIEDGKKLYNAFLDEMKQIFQGKIGSGIFQAHMEIDYVNDGPVTILLDSEKNF